MRHNAQSLVEVMVAIVFLAAGGMAVYTASQRGLSEAAWGAERVSAEGLVNDLVQVYRRFTYGELSGRPEVVKYSGPLSDAIKQTTTDQLTALEAVSPLSVKSLLPDPANDSQLASDPVAKEFLDDQRVLNLKRIVLFKDVPADGCAQVSCVVQWKSRAGPVIEATRQFIVFKTVP